MDIHQNNDNLDTSLNDQNYDSIDNSVNINVPSLVDFLIAQTGFSRSHHI